MLHAALGLISHAPLFLTSQPCSPKSALVQVAAMAVVMAGEGAVGTLSMGLQSASAQQARRSWELRPGQGRKWSCLAPATCSRPCL